MTPERAHTPIQALTDNKEGLTLRVSGATQESFARLEEAASTPFQSAGWLKAFLESHDALADFRLIEISRDDAPSLMLPLVLTRRAGLTYAQKIGGGHASYFVPPSSDDRTAWPGAVLTSALGRAGALAGIDAFLLADCPESWRGTANVLAALPHQPAPSDGAGVTLGTDGEAIFAQFSDRGDSKKFRQKSTKLAAFGPLVTGWVEVDEVPAALTQYYGWKAQQFAAMGIADPFSEPAIRRFLAMAIGSTSAPIRLFALKAGERLLAIIGGAQTGGTISGRHFSGRHFSGMFTAYDPAPEIARNSPGEVLIAGLIPTLSREGFTHFDLGVGEARYKTHYCPERIALLDIALPVTIPGRIAAAGWLLARKTKRAIKQNPALFQRLKWFRRLLGR